VSFGAWPIFLAGVCVGLAVAFAVSWFVLNSVLCELRRARRELEEAKELLKGKD